MPLELIDIKRELEHTGMADNLKQASLHEERVRMHSDVVFDDKGIATAKRKFFDMAKSLLPQDKFQMMETLFQYPVETVAFTEELYQTLEKVFDGRNPVYEVLFTKPEFEQDWMRYRTEIQNQPRVWRERGWSKMKSGINSVLVVDLPKQQVSELPEPYFYWISMSSVVTLKTCYLGLEWIIFCSEEDTVTVLDDTSYRVFEYKDKVFGKLISESAHGLGQCPANWFWPTPVSGECDWMRASPITTQLGALDWLLFSYLCKKHLGLYAAFPIYSGYEQDCDYEIEIENGEKVYCSGGYLRHGRGYNGTILNPMECPLCRNKRFTGPGSYIEIPIPEPGGTDLRNPVQKLDADVASIQENTAEVGRQEQRIRERVIGSGGEPFNSQAMNETQILGNFEARTNTLRSFKKNWEKTMTWADTISCGLRYGVQKYGGNFVSVSVDLGTEFYLLSPEEWMQAYKFAREAEAHTSVLTFLEDQYFDTLYRNNAHALARIKIVLALDPARHQTREQVKAMYEAGILEYKDYVYKINAETLNQKFERDVDSLTEFAATTTDFGERIEKIRQAIYSFIKNAEQDERTEKDSIGVGTRAGKGIAAEAESETGEPDDTETET